MVRWYRILRVADRSTAKPDQTDAASGFRCGRNLITPDPSKLRLYRWVSQLQRRHDADPAWLVARTKIAI